MTIFLILGGIGLALLLISLIFGDLFDFDGGGMVSIPGIAIGLTVFGASGAIAWSSGLEETFWAYLIAIVIGLIAYSIAALVVRAITRSNDDTPRDVTGSTGTSMSPITVASGEVSLDAVGEIERRLAFAEEDIPSGVRIRVVGMYGARVKVEPLRKETAPAAEGSSDPDAQA